jgi:hypothetical protein
MTTEDWLKIAEVIATVLLIAATVRLNIATVRLTNATSAAHQRYTPPPAEHGDRWSRRVLKSPWIQSPWRLPPVLILTYVVQLIFDLRKTGPVTRGLIFNIAFDMAGVVWGAVLLLMVFIVRELMSQADSERTLLHYISEGFREILDLQLDIVNRHMEVHRLQAEMDRDIIETLKETAPREILGRALDIIESMSAEIEKVKQKSERRPGLADLFRR